MPAFGDGCQYEAYLMMVSLLMGSVERYTESIVQRTKRIEEDW